MRVDFGAGSLTRLGAGLDGARRVCVVTDPGLRAAGVLDRLLEVLAGAGVAVTVIEDVEPNPSTHCLDRAATVVRAADADLLVALGGGSAIDAAKGIALLATNPVAAADLADGTGPRVAGLPLVAVPTTAGTGAETNGFAVIEDRERRCKVYLGDDSVRPAYVVLDPALTLGVPAAVTAATGMDALVHGIESLASLGATARSATFAAQAVSLVGSSLAAAVADGDDLTARSQLLFGAHLAGRALTLSGLGLVHGIAHAVTARTGAAHGRALSAVVVEVMEHSLADAVPAYAAAGRACGLQLADDLAAARAAIEHTRDLADAVGARTSLSALGVGSADLAELAVTALADPVSRNHPRALPVDEVSALLGERLEG